MFMEKEIALEDKERLVKEINTEIRRANYAVIHEVWKDGESEAIKTCIKYLEQVEKQKKVAQNWEQAVIILDRKNRSSENGSRTSLLRVPDTHYSLK